MSTIRLMGSQKAYLRCYRLGFGETIRHFRSAARFTGLNNISSTVTSHSSPGLDGEKALLFVEQQHLPVDLSVGLERNEDFQRFCRVIGFTSEVLALRNQDRLPTSPADHTLTTASHCPGFPVTRPEMMIDLTSSISFHELELRSFLGEMYPRAGKMMILNLQNSDGQPMQTIELQHLIREFSSLLAK